MKKRNFNIPVRYLIFILAFVCVGLMAASYISPAFSRAVTGAGYTVLAPLQRTLNAAGSRLSSTFSELGTISSIREENAALRARVDALEEENRLLYQNIYELQELRELYDLSMDYTQYDTIGAQVVQRSTGN